LSIWRIGEEISQNIGMVIVLNEMGTLVGQLTNSYGENILE
jgi:hypothetical protein